MRITITGKRAEGKTCVQAVIASVLTRLGYDVKCFDDGYERREPEVYTIRNFEKRQITIDTKTTKR